MKRRFYQKLFVAVLVLSLCGVQACKDDTINLDDLDKSVAIGGEIEMPLVKTSRFTVAELLDSLKNKNSIEGLSIDSLDDKTITLMYRMEEKNFELRKINQDFEDFQQTLENGLTVADLIEQNDIVAAFYAENGAKTLQTTDIRDESYSIPLQFDEPNLRKIKYAKLDATIDVSVTTTVNIQNAGGITVLSADLTIPTISEDFLTQGTKVISTSLKSGTGTTVYTTQEQLILDCTRNIEIDFHLRGDGATYIGSTDDLKAELKFTPNMDDFKIWGWFNYVLANQPLSLSLQQELAEAPIQEYLSDGTELSFADPRFTFDVETNLGIPLVFELYSLSTRYKGTQNPGSLGNHAFDLNRATDDHPTVDSIFYINKNVDWMSAVEKEDYGKMFSTQLDTIDLQYIVKTQTVDVNVANPELPLQYLGSDSYVKFFPAATLPLHFNKETRIRYDEIIEQDFLDAADVDSSYDNMRGKVVFNYINTLPIPLYATVYTKETQDESELGEEYVRLRLEPNTTTLTPYETNNITIKDLTAAKYLRIVYDSAPNPKFPNPETDADKYFSAPFTLKTTDYAEVQVGLKMEGYINVSE